MPTAHDLSMLDGDELSSRLGESRRELFNLRFQLATGQLDNPSRISQVKREVARMLTVLRAREILEAEGAYVAPTTAEHEGALAKLAAEDAADGLRVGRGDGGDVQAELEAGPPPWHPHHPVADILILPKINLQRQHLHTRDRHVDVDRRLVAAGVGVFVQHFAVADHAGFHSAVKAFGLLETEPGFEAVEIAEQFVTQHASRMNGNPTRARSIR